MGFGDAQVRSAIESSGGDENVALEKLCSGQNPSNQASFGARYDINLVYNFMCCVSVLV